MANNPSGGPTDEYFQQILANPSFYLNQTSNSEVNNAILPGNTRLMPLHQHQQLNSGEGSSSGDGSGFQELGFRLGTTNGFEKTDEQLGLRLEQMARNGFEGFQEINRNVSSANNGSESVQFTSLFPPLERIQPHSVPPPIPQPLHAQPAPNTGVIPPNPPVFRPRVRARRGQATDPHSIAERLRRERIAERMKALQELVPTFNKTDKATMLDEVVDYVKFLRLQVKVLSMSRLGGTGAVAQLVADGPLQSVEGEDIGPTKQVSEKWSNSETEEQVAKLMEKDVGTAMQFLQSKALCIMPISLASAIYPIYEPDSSSTLLKPE